MTIMVCLKYMHAKGCSSQKFFCGFSFCGFSSFLAWQHCGWCRSTVPSASPLISEAEELLTFVLHVKYMYDWRFFVYYWRAGASQPRMARFFYIRIYMSRRTAHILHMRMRGIYAKPLRGMCTLCPLNEFEGSAASWRLSRCGEWRTVGDTSVQAPTLEIHRKQRLPTDTPKTLY